jgi:hypothetical protein
MREMASFRLLAAAPLLLLPAVASAEGPGVCHTVAVELQPQSNGGQSYEEPPQIVIWVETTAGQYVTTLYITAQTGRYGMGNRPGRFDFNSGPMWPYGRRLTTFPVWAHKHGQTFPVVEFQNAPDNPFDCFSGSGSSYTQCGENNLSHPFDQSSPEKHFCQPLMPTDGKWTTAADAMTCATMAFTDKGKFASAAPTDTSASLYPPRTDVLRSSPDSASVDQYKSINPFDAVSQATPVLGQQAQITWPIPQDLPMPMGDYVMFVEVSKAFDTNATYNSTSYPPPSGISWSDYGIPYRGQPSVLYKIPFTIGLADTVASTAAYAGYGDPTGQDGAIRPPDSTITTDTPGSGGNRLQMMTDGARVRVTTHPEFDSTPPGDPSNIQAVDVEPTDVMLSFVAPGDDGIMGKVTSYEVRYMAGTPITDDNFEQGMVLTDTIAPVDPGQVQTFDVTGLLPSTNYYIGIRANDNCGNSSHVIAAKVTTLASKAGEVDACFVATAAYGSLMANDVEMLRHFRDSFLQKSVLGELGVEAYYTFGPGVAGVVGQSELLRTTARDALSPIVGRVRKLSF